MVARRPKLAAAGLVLAAGMAMAWPLRRDEPLPAGRRGVASAAAAEPSLASVETATPALAKSQAPADVEPASPVNRPDRDPFANVPSPNAETTSPTAPVFSTISNGAETAPAPPEPEKHRIHVVHEGDSLDRLAKRYLGDEGRALEIFDLNREALDNPHVLRLGTELKIPISGEAAAE